MKKDAVINIRIPQTVKNKLKKHAENKGITLTKYIIELIKSDIMLKK